MKIRNLAAAAAAVSLAAAPVMAQAAPAARASAPTKETNKLNGGSLLLAILGISAIVTGIVIAASSNNNPVSP